MYNAANVGGEVDPRIGEKDLKGGDTVEYAPPVNRESPVWLGSEAPGQALIRVDADGPVSFEEYLTHAKQRRNFENGIVE